MRLRLVLVPFFAALLMLESGCAFPEARWGGTDAVSDPAGPAAKRAQLLAADIRSLAPAVDPQEASAVALRAVQYSAQLAPLSPSTLEFHFAVAREGRPREHNALVVSARGTPMEAGIVLDPWRHSGRLVWAPFGKDRYPWTRPTNIVTSVVGPR